ncbi:MAG: sulfite exporter TauE/SafE family protein [bacterium]|nr:sulfite exporter TauE/SafE family protein [bacterium]
MEYLIGSGLALWFGILTSISPCPLATNITAISFISKKVSNTRLSLITGILYILGRTVVYIVLALLIVKTALSIPAVSNFLQVHLNTVVGPILIITGMFILNLFSLSLPGFMSGEKSKVLLEKNEFIGSFLLGMLFALSFCPVSAALYFGSLIPLSIKYSSTVFYPALYGLGTALPVVLFAILISIGSQYIGNIYKKINSFEKWTRIITGTIFILAGIYFCLVFIFKIGA